MLRKIHSDHQASDGESNYENPFYPIHPLLGHPRDSTCFAGNGLVFVARYHTFLIARERHSRGRVENCRGEYSGALRGGGHAEDLRKGIQDSLAIVIQEEKRAVFDDWPAKSAAELVLPKWRRRAVGGIEKVSGVENVIPEKFVRAAVKAVRAGLSDDIDQGYAR
jgi:hypothetical protein